MVTSRVVYGGQEPAIGDIPGPHVPPYSRSRFFFLLLCPPSRARFSVRALRDLAPCLSAQKGRFQ